MKFIKKLSKRTRIISLMILLVMVSATTIAFLQDYTSTITNSFSIKSIHTEIDENNQSSTLTKIPFVKNTDATDVMVRIRLDISGNTDNLFPDTFVLAGFGEDYGYAVGSDNFNNITFDDETVMCGQYKSGELTSTYWTQDGTNPYSSYYYYKNVLKAQGTTGIIEENNIKTEIPLDVTQPLFDRILLKVVNNGETSYISYDQASSEQQKKFAALENIQISIYQESVPVSLKDGDKTYNADKNNDGVIDSIEDANYIWNYFMNE